MKVAKIAILVVVALTALAVLPAAAQEDAYVQGELLVKFRHEASAENIASVIRGIDGALLRRFSLVDNLVHIRLPERLVVPEAVRLLQREGLVEYAEPNYLRHAWTTPDDPGLARLWGLENTGQTGGTAGADIHALDAWSITTGSENTVVAVIDTGVDMAHVDLAANIWTNPGEIPGNGVDDDHNGYVDDVHGWDFHSNDNDPSDTNACKHGTHVSGTIGAGGNNGTGVVGVNWRVKIIPLRFLGGLLCTGSDANAIKAIEYASSVGARVANNSWGGGPYDRALEDAIRRSNMIFVAAAGNGGLDQKADNIDLAPSYPASFPLENIISVAATDHRDAGAPFSNYGPASVDLAAPGVDIASTVPGNAYAYMSGTSMATPHVTGAVGLLLSQDPGLENWQVIWKVLQGVDKKDLPVLTGGRLNAYNSLLLNAPVKRSFEEDAAAYTGTWTAYADPGFSGGLVKYASQKDAAAEFSFSGSGVMWIASLATMLGKADVYIDGVLKTTVDLYRPSTLHKQVAYSNLALIDGAHTLKIVVRGDKNASATNTLVAVDGIEVVR